MIRILFAFIFLFCINIAFAQQVAEIDQEREDLSGAYAECAAYYRLVFFALESSGEAETAASYREVEDNAMLYALVLASGGRDRDMAVQVTNARIELSMQQMKDEINNRNENISILINKYNGNCTQIMQQLPEILLEAMVEVSGGNTNN
ncbi:MAG: hypothetical protein A3H44_01195 [Gammaproteobacteria bacterium RIFCSPLOWO2_02_FULL_57_10]|nr:MAG: hypothetical protein A3H44_01195 [Gammaproteobacteria bacterium RIFCSPLOWO2_02_FULL_57_10]